MIEEQAQVVPVLHNQFRGQGIVLFKYEMVVIWAPGDMHIGGLFQDCRNCIANALELLQSCTKPSTLFTLYCGLVLSKFIAIYQGDLTGTDTSCDCFSASEANLGPGLLSESHVKIPVKEHGFSDNGGQRTSD